MIKTGSLHIRKAQAGLRKAKQEIGKTQKTFQGSLTSSVIGSEDEDDSAEVRQQRAPNSIRRRKPTRGQNTVSWNSIQQKTFINDESSQQMKHGGNSSQSNTSGVRQPVAEGTKSTGQTSARQTTTGSVNRRVSREAAKGTGKKVFSAAAATSKKVGGAAAKGTKVAAGAATGAATAGTGAAAIAVASAAKKSKEKAKQIAVRAKAALETSMQSQGSKKHTPFSQEEGGDKKKQNSASGIGPALIAAMGFLLVFVFMMILMLMIASDIQKKKNEQEDSRTKIVAIAEAELEVSDSNIGGTKYKTWYNMDANWCAMFVSWCSNECGYIEDGIMPSTASVANMRAWYEERDEFHEVSSDYEPQSGDVIIFGNGTSHTGLVVKYDVSTGEITTIEGNTGSSSTKPYHKGSHVKQKKYSKSYAKISGYCSPAYPVSEESTTETELTETEK